MAPDLVHTLAIAVGGAAGASCRASCYVFAARVFKTGRGSSFPHGTYLANVLGSLLLGLLTGLVLSGHVSVDVRDVVGTGFCGALTTFSTFSSDGRVLIEKRRWRALLAHLVVNLGVGFGAAALGYHLGRHA